MPGPWYELPHGCNPCKKGLQTRSQLRIHKGTQAHLNKRIALASALDNARRPCGQGAFARHEPQQGGASSRPPFQTEDAALQHPQQQRCTDSEVAADQAGPFAATNREALLPARAHASGVTNISSTHLQYCPGQRSCLPALLLWCRYCSAFQAKTVSAC